MGKARITIGRLKELIRYDPETGVFVWLKTNSNRAPAGSRAGRDNGNGYRRIMLDGRTYYEHHLAWFYIHEAWPEFEIDHQDGERSNNRISNLRPATHAQNGQNQPLRSTNTSGMHGVSWSKPHSKWTAYIWAGGKKKHLGLFAEREAARQAYLVAKRELHTFQPVPRDVAQCR